MLQLYLYLITVSYVWYAEWRKKSYLHSTLAPKVLFSICCIIKSKNWKYKQWLMQHLCCTMLTSLLNLQLWRFNHSRRRAWQSHCPWLDTEIYTSRFCNPILHRMWGVYRRHSNLHKPAFCFYRSDQSFKLVATLGWLDLVKNLSG